MSKSKFACLIVAASMAVLAGCPATAPKHGQYDEVEYFPDGAIKKKVVAASDYALYIQANKASAPVAKVNLPAPGGGNYAVEIPMVAGQQQAIAPPEQEKSVVDRVLDRGERWLSFALQGYAINRGAAVQMRQSDNQKEERVAGINGYVQMGGQIQRVGSDGFVTLGQVPRVNQINVSGNALLGDGNLNVNSGNTTRQCTGGQAGNAAPGGNASGTTTPTGGAGAQGGSGGNASC